MSPGNITKSVQTNTTYPGGKEPGEYSDSSSGEAASFKGRTTKGHATTKSEKTATKRRSDDSIAKEGSGSKRRKVSAHDSRYSEHKTRNIKPGSDRQAERRRASGTGKNTNTHKTGKNVPSLQTHYEECIADMKGNRYSDARHGLYRLSRTYPDWHKEPAKTAERYQFTKEEKKTLFELSDLYRTLEFIRIHHPDLEETGRFSSTPPGLELPTARLHENYGKLKSNYQELQQGMIFVDKFLLNPDFKTDNQDFERRKVNTAYRHLIWLLESKMLNAGFHSMWQTNYLKACEEKVSLGESFLQSEEGQFFNTCKKTITAIQSANDKKQAMEILHEHFNWVREQKFAPLALVSLACSANVFTREYANSRGQFEPLRELSGAYFYSARLLGLGSCSSDIESTCKSLKALGRCNIPIEDYPRLFPPLLKVLLTSWSPDNFKRVKATMAQHCAVALTTDYLDALELINLKRYKEAREKIKTALNSEYQPLEKEALNLLMALSYHLEGNQRDDVVKSLSECKLTSSTQIKLQLIRLQMAVDNREEVRELMHKQDDIFLTRAYKPVLDYLEDKKSMTDKTSQTEFSTKTSIATPDETSLKLASQKEQLFDQQKKIEELESELAISKKKYSHSKKTNSQLQKSWVKTHEHTKEKLKKLNEDYGVLSVKYTKTCKDLNDSLKEKARLDLLAEENVKSFTAQINTMASMLEQNNESLVKEEMPQEYGQKSTSPGETGKSLQQTTINLESKQELSVDKEKLKSILKNAQKKTPVEENNEKEQEIAMQLQAENKQLRQTKETQAAEIERVEHSVNDLKDQVDTYKQEIANLKEKNKNLRETRKNQKSEIKSINRMNKLLEKQAKIHSELIMKLQAKNEELEKTKETQATNIECADHSIDLLKDANDAHEETIKQLQEKNRELHKAIENQEANSEINKFSMMSTFNENQSLKTEIKELRAKEKELTTKIEAKDKEIESLKCDFDLDDITLDPSAADFSVMF